MAITVIVNKPDGAVETLRHRCRRPVSGHGTALLKALPNGASAYLSSIGRDEAVENGEPLPGACTHMHVLVGNGYRLAQVGS